MKKEDAIKLFGTVSETANAIGINPQAVSQWPEMLSKRITDRVIAAAYRKNIVEKLHREVCGHANAD